MKIAIIGSGSMARQRSHTFNRLSGCDIAAIVARNPKTGTKLSREFGCPLYVDWSAVVDSTEIDCVAICTHNQIHGEIAISALEKGKHVFCEYPAARYLGEVQQLRAFINSRGPVFRFAHGEQVSHRHRKLKEIIRECGELTIAQFTRLTAGRGVRPEILFNLNLSGPPALFFVYHVYPVIDFFGPVKWVESVASYENLDESGAYNRFLNTLQVEFCYGGYGQWTWAGGIEITRSLESQRMIISDGTLSRENSCRWLFSSSDGERAIEISEVDDRTLEEQFCNEISEGSKGWKKDAALALQAAEIGIFAEEAARTGKRIQITRDHSIKDNFKD